MISYKDDGWFVTAQHDSSSLFFGNNNLKKNTQNFIQKSEHIRNSTTTIHVCKVSLKVQMEEWARDKVTPGFGKVSIFCAICQYFVQISIFCANVNILCKHDNFDQIAQKYPWTVSVYLPTIFRPPFIVTLIWQHLFSR